MAVLRPFSSHFFVNYINIFHKTTKDRKTAIYQSRKFWWSVSIRRDLVKKFNYFLVASEDVPIKTFKRLTKKPMLIFSLLCHDFEKCNFWRKSLSTFLGHWGQEVIFEVAETKIGPLMGNGYWAAYVGGEKNQNRRTLTTHPNRCHYPLMTYLSPTHTGYEDCKPL